MSCVALNTPLIAAQLTDRTIQQQRVYCTLHCAVHDAESSVVCSMFLESYAFLSETKNLMLLYTFVLCFSMYRSGTVRSGVARIIATGGGGRAHGVRVHDTGGGRARRTYSRNQAEITEIYT